MTNPWIAALSALFLWWFSTGIIIWRVKRADNEGRDAHLWSVILGLPLLLGGFGAMHHTLGNDTATGAFVAFVAALAIWGWIELAFLSGIIAGPNTRPCPPHAPLWERFLRACGTIAWHELTLMASLGVLAQMSDGMANRVGLWTFAIRLSAIIGPVTYGLITLLSAGNHRLAIFGTGLFFVLGLVLLRAVDVRRGIAAAQAAL